MYSQLHKSQFVFNSEILPHASFFSCWNLSELLQDLICAAKCVDSEFCIDAGLPLCNLTCIDVASRAAYLTVLLEYLHGLHACGARSKGLERKMDKMKTPNRKSS